jgi:allantoin racemase
LKTAATTARSACADRFQPTTVGSAGAAAALAAPAALPKEKAMKIRVINPFGGTEFYGRDNLARIKRPDTQFDMVNIGDRYPLKNNQWLYFRHACTDPTLERVLEAERQACDAVYISCNLDIGLYEARQLVSIPVTGTLESAALLAHMMGSTFSLVTVDYQNGKIQEMLLHQYGLAGKFISQRPFCIDANDLYVDRTQPAQVVERVVEVARQCVELDGAEVVIPGCTLAGSILTWQVPDIESRIGAPVLDGMVAGFKLAEMLADLRAAGMPIVSRRGYFERPPAADYQLLRRALEARGDR